MEYAARFLLSPGPLGLHLCLAGSRHPESQVEVDAGAILAAAAWAVVFWPDDRSCSQHCSPSSESERDMINHRMVD
jgi:hypothetical protein